MLVIIVRLNLLAAVDKTIDRMSIYYAKHFKMYIKVITSVLTSNGFLGE